MYTTLLCPFTLNQNSSFCQPFSWFTVIVVQLLSRVRLLETPQIAARQASLSITNSRNLLKLTSTESVMPSSHLILCRPLLLLPSNFPSIRVFSSELTLRIRWPKDWSFGFLTSPFNEYSGLISFSIDWFDLLAVQGTLRSLLQHHSLKASILWLLSLTASFPNILAQKWFLNVLSNFSLYFFFWVLNIFFFFSFRSCFANLC